MSAATTGRAREYKVRDHLIARGWLLVARSAGSKGAADLVMVHPYHGLALVQVGTANKTLGPDDRERLCFLADLCSALPLVAQVIPRPGKPTRITFWHVTRDTPATWPEWPTRLAAITTKGDQ